MLHSNTLSSSAQKATYWQWLFSNLHSDLGSGRSAEALAPVIVDLLRPKSVIDVGCGVGSWLLAFQAAGVRDVLGVDGEHLDRRYLRIAPERIVTADLRDRLSLGRTFDVALCLEVAGYIPPEYAENLVRTLTDAAPVVLFSSAIPSQDEERNQCNQQWPDYWAEMFARRGFLPVDLIRKMTWDNDEIAWWYRQNAVLYVNENHMGTNARLRLAWERDPGLPDRLVHPQHYLQLQSELGKGPLTLALKGLKSSVGRRLPTGVKSALRKLYAKPPPVS